MKKFAVAAIAALGLAGLTGLAVAQTPPPDIQMEGTMSPTKGGSKKKPKRGKLGISFTVNKESRSTTDQITIYAPQHARLSGKGFRYCSTTQIATNGVASCPKKSKIGGGTATAVLGPRQAPLSFTIQAFWGSRNAMTFYLEQEGGSLKVPLNGPVTKAGAPYGQQITVDIPKGVSEPAPGVYSQITGLSVQITGTTTKKVRKTIKRKGKKRKVTRRKRFNAVSLRGCPKDRTHDYAVRLRFIANPNPPTVPSAQQGDTSACSKR